MQVSMEVSFKWYYDFWLEWSSIPKVPQIASFQCLCNISKKKLEMKFIFLHADKHQIFQQVNFNTLGIKVSYKVILSLLTGTMKHCQSTQSNKFAISLQRLKKKTLGMEFIFCMQINTKVSKSWDYCFWWKSPDMSKSTHYFCNIYRKDCCSCFCVLLLYKTFRYFPGFQSCSLLLVSLHSHTI